MKFENIFCYINVVFLKSFIDLVYKVIKASIQVLICYAYQLKEVKIPTRDSISNTNLKSLEIYI